MPSPSSPWFKSGRTQIEELDSVLLLTPGHKRYLVRTLHGQTLHTHLGVFKHDDIIGSRLGDIVRSQLNHAGLLLEPSLVDLMTRIKRDTPIVYPKDAAWLVFRLSLRSGSRVLEAGTGSAGFTTALAWAVAPEGHVYTYEARPETFDLARRNLERVGLLPFVTMHPRRLQDGPVEKDMDAVFLDVREPWKHLEIAAGALIHGGYFGGVVPTTNQLSALVAGLDAHRFVDIAVEELLLRAYKPVADRLRPEDSMIAHTGYLVTARCLAHLEDTTQWQAKEKLRRRGRLRAQDAAAAEAAPAEDEDDDATGGSDSGPVPPRKYPKLPLPD